MTFHSSLTAECSQDLQRIDDLLYLAEGLNPPSPSGARWLSFDSLPGSSTSSNPVVRSEPQSLLRVPGISMSRKDNPEPARDLQNHLDTSHDLYVSNHVAGGQPLPSSRILKNLFSGLARAFGAFSKLRLAKKYTFTKQGD